MIRYGKLSDEGLRIVSLRLPISRNLEDISLDFAWYDNSEKILFV